MFDTHRVIRFMASLFAAVVLFMPMHGNAVQEIRPTVVAQAGVNGSLVVSASLRLAALLDSNVVYVVDLSTGLLLRRVEAVMATAIALSDDDRYLAIGGANLEVLDLVAGESVISLDGKVGGIGFSGDGHWLAVSTKNEVIQLPTSLRKIAPQLPLSIANASALGGRGVGAACTGAHISLSTDGRQLVCATSHDDSYGWALVDMATGTVRNQESPPVVFAAVTPDGRSVLEISDAKRMARLYDVSNPARVQETRLLSDPEKQEYFVGYNQSIGFRDNAEAVVLLGHQVHRISLNPLRAKKLDASLADTLSGYQTQFGMDPAGRVLITTRHYDLADRFKTGETPLFHLRDLDALEQPPFRTIFTPETNSFAVQPTAQGLLLAQRFRDRARVTNLTTGAVLYEQSGLRGIGVRNSSVNALVDASGRKAYFERDLDRRDEESATSNARNKDKWAGYGLITAEKNKLRERVLVDLTTGHRIPIKTQWQNEQIITSFSPPLGALFSPLGNFLLTIGEDYQTETDLVATIDGSVIHTWRRPDAFAHALANGLCAFSDDEKRLFCGGKVFSIPDGKLLVDITGQAKGEIRKDMMSPDGRWLKYRDDDSRTHVLSIVSGKEVLTEAPVFWAKPSWSPDNRLIEYAERETPNTTIYSFSDSGEVAQTKVSLNDCTRPILTGQSVIVCLSEVVYSGNSGHQLVGRLQTVQIHDEKTGQLIKRYPLPLTGGYAFSHDGRQLLLGTDSGQTILELKSGEMIANLSVGSDDWVISLPEGYYTAPRGVNKLIAIRKGNHAYSFDEFDLTLNRPDLVRERLGAPAALVKALKRALAKRVQRFGVIDEASRPTVEIEQASLPLLTDDAQIKVAFNAEAVKGAKLTRAQVYVNGVPTLGRDGMAVTPDASGKVSQQLPVELTPGSNRIQVSVFDDKGIESLRDTGVVTRKAAPAPITRYVLAVGVSQYQDATLNLDYAAKDATDLAAALQRSSPGIERTVVKTLTDAEVTRDKLRDARQFFAEAKPQDQAIVFIAGHGLLDDKDDYYFAGYDINANNPAANGVPLPDIEDLFADTKARRRLLLLDSCHSGEVDHDMEQKLAALPQGVSGTRALKLKSDAPKPANSEEADSTQAVAYVTELFADLRRGVGATALASASGTELAMESAQYKNGLFTSAVLEALNDQSTDTDGTRSIEMSELRDRVAARVRALSNGTQTPSTRVENYDENLLMSAWEEAKEEPVKTATKSKGKKKK